jgi:hypothetical protein
MERLSEVLFEPGDGLRDLLARDPRGHKAPELRAVWTCQQADGDFLLDQRRQPGNQCRLVEQREMVRARTLVAGASEISALCLLCHQGRLNADSQSVASTISEHCQFLHGHVISGNAFDGSGKRRGGLPPTLGQAHIDAMTELLDHEAHLDRRTRRLPHRTRRHVDGGYYNIGTGSDAESIRTIHRALDLGLTHLDTAEIYGPYTNEDLVEPAIKERREKLMLATKVRHRLTLAADQASSTAARRTSASRSRVH